jgi:acyl-CoA thioesterase FadM
VRPADEKERIGGSSSFDSAITPRLRSNGDYELSIDSSWWVDIGPNGGFLSAVLTRVAEFEASRHGISHVPASASIHYLRASRVGLATVSARLVRSGRTTSVFHLDIHQENGGTLVTALFTMVEQTAQVPDSQHHDAPLSPPPTSDGVRPLYEGPSPAYLEQWEFKPVRGHLPFSSPMDTPVGPLECAGWIRLREHRSVDATLLAAMADAWPPVIFGVLEGPTLVPTLSFNLVWRAPSSRTRWCFIVLRTEELSGGLVDETVEIRAEDGTLLLQGRQLAQFNSTTRDSFQWKDPGSSHVVAKVGEQCA